MKLPSSPDVKAPKFLTDIYRDLDDRRLLVPVILLLVALVAVPVFLSTSTEAPPPPAPVPLDEDATAVQPAVLAEEVGIRDYRKRLEDFKRDNPFKQKFLIPPIDEGALAGESADSSAGLGGIDSGATDTSTATTGDTGAVTGGGSLPTGDTGATTSSGGATTGSEPAATPAPEVDTVTRFFEHRIDAKVGRADQQLELHEGVREFDLLPGASAPVLAFLGATSDDDAAFVVSPDATPVDGGDGRCVPSGSDCLFMTLEIGDEQKFDYAPDGERYELKLVDVYQHRLKGSQGD